MNEYEERFILAAKAHGSATREGDSRKTNRAYDSAVSAIKKIRMEPDRGARFLLEQLRSEDLSVVAWAASYLLPLEEGEEEAVLALQRVSREKDDPLISFGAETILKEWQAGRLSIE